MTVATPGDLQAVDTMVRRLAGLPMFAAERPRLLAALERIHGRHRELVAEYQALRRLLEQVEADSAAPPSAAERTAAH